MLPTLFALALAGAAAPTTVPEPHTVVSVYVLDHCAAPQGCLPLRIVTRMKQEAERIWSSLDVGISWIDSVDVRPPGKRGLIAMLEEQAYPGWVAERGFVLGGLHPPAAACEWGVARLWVRHVRQFAAAARPGGHPFDTLPNSLADALVGRALGRALAHEIGHYVLRLTTHSSRGLMRAAFGPQELLEDVTPVLYGLDPRQRAALVPCDAEELAERNRGESHPCRAHHSTSEVCSQEGATR